MAIIPDVPGITVDILVNGHPLTEYTDEEDDESTCPAKVMRYVECISGANFAIRWAYGYGLPLNGADCAAVFIRMDGKPVDSICHSFPGDYRSPTVFHGARFNDRGLWKQRPFQFADIIMSESGPRGDLPPELKHLGTITVEFICARLVSEITTPTIHDQAVERKTVQEKHLKGLAISHQVEFGEARPVDAVFSSWNVQLLDNQKAFATYEFRYRSHKSLQSLMLIPRSPTPLPLEERPRDELTREELLELLRRQDLRQEQQRKIKKELKRDRQEDEDDLGTLEVNSTRRPAKAAKSTIDTESGVETVDLTDA